MLSSLYQQFIIFILVFIQCFYHYILLFCYYAVIIITILSFFLSLHLFISLVMHFFLVNLINNIFHNSPFNENTNYMSKIRKKTYTKFS